MKPLVALLTLLSLLLPACRFFTLNVTAQKSAEEKQTLFDQLIALAPGKKVPYPFAELLAYLAPYGDYFNPVALIREMLKNLGYAEH